MFGFLRRKSARRPGIRELVYANFEKRMQAGGELTLDGACDSFLYWLCQLWDPVVQITEERKRASGDGKSFDQFSEACWAKYGVEPTSFEVGCHSIFRMDMWHHKNTPHEYRKVVFLSLRRSFVSAFGTLLTESVAESVLDQRMDFYGAMARARTDQDGFLYEQAQFIEATVTEGCPKVRTEGPRTIRIGDAFESYWLKVRLLAFEQAMLPRFLEMFAALHTHRKGSPP